MTRDPRLWPANARVALEALRGQVEGVRFVPGTPAVVEVSEVPLTRRPDGGQDKVLLHGEPLTVIEDAPIAFVRSDWDGYVGYVPEIALARPVAATHRIVAFASHVYAAPDIKAPARMALSIGAEISATSTSGSYLQTRDGFVPRQHCVPVDRAQSVVDTLCVMLGTPYLWGGNSHLGIDCSGLVQLALRLAGHACPRDSDQQAAALGDTLDPSDPLRPGDLVFWQGHVGVMLTEADLVHANAHHMAVVQEPFEAARARIAQSEFGQITCRRRIAGLV